MILSNKLYDLLKAILLKGVPAINAFLLVMAETWGGLPFMSKVVATIDALAVLAGVFVDICSKKYYEVMQEKEQNL